MKKISLALLITAALGSFVWAQNPITSQKEPAACPLCDQMDQINKSADEDESKAARELAVLLADAKFSKKPETKAMEYERTIRLASRLVEKDDSFEIAQYLVSLRDEDPKAYNAAILKLSEKDRKALKVWEQKMRQFMKKGEEG